MIINKYLFSIVFFLGCFSLALILSLQKKNPYPDVCNLVVEKIYLSESEVESWRKLCFQRSRLVKPWTSNQIIINDLNKILKFLKVSHLEVFSPEEANKAWNGVAKENGISSEFIEGELVVTKIAPDSPADKEGFKYGDVIESSNGESPNPWQLNNEISRVVIKRRDQMLEKNLIPAEVKMLNKIELSQIEKTKAWLIKIPSFRKEFFVKNDINENDQILNTNKILIDLRGNQGGNFVAGLNFLSPFLCKSTEIGRLIKPGSRQKNIFEMPNNLDDLIQLSVLQRSKAIILKTFENSKCINPRAKIIVLIDSQTSSVAEMVAQALKENRNAKINGATSSGQLLVGVWYPLDELGKGVEISIPEAVYISNKNFKIEGAGIKVDKSLEYKINEMQMGKDSWIWQSLEE